MSWDWAKINFSLGMANAMINGTSNYYKDIKNNNPYAAYNYTNSIMTGYMRNGIAYDMALRGNPIGQSTNAMIGYSTPEANNFAMSTLFLQNMAMMPPYMGGFGMSPFMRAPGMFWC